MRKRSFIVFVAILSFIRLSGQDDHVLTLRECYDLAEKNHPLQRRIELLEESSKLAVENLNKNYLPRLALNGQVSYQSDVTKVPAKVPVPALEIEPIDKDWYKASIDLQQVIYDGGSTKHAKILEEQQNEIRQQEVVVDLYSLKSGINKAYFNILLMQENLAILQLHEEVLNERMKEVEAGVNHGVILESNLLVLQAEKLRILQNEAELRMGIEASMNILEELISEEIPVRTKLEIPDYELVPGPNSRRRPEYDLIAREQIRLHTLDKMAGVRDLPKFYAFGQAGVGRPALDMLNNSFDGFYIVGIKMSWNFWNWGKTRREREIFEINRMMLDNQKEVVDKNLAVELQQKLADFNKYEELIAHDDKIISMQAEIVRTYESQLNNGVITSTEYLSELNARTEAMLMRKMHEIRQVQAGIEYLTTIGETQ
jgi:outer membrane protein TolC